ncbi:MAG TPA: M1 family aminopeptidase [Chthonomonadaceae bacterium]|nr:M1 family aminopeptidase [Chthonomonadaceae bacterium]
MKRPPYTGSRLCGLLLFIAGSVLLTACAGRLASQSLAGRQQALSAAVAAIPQDVPEGINLLVRRATLAANTRRPAEMAPLASGDAGRDFAWVKNTTSTWSGGVLIPPGTTPPTYLAIFHAWHTCESDGDHVYTLLHTPEGWRLGAEIPETDPAGFRVRDHDLNVTLHVAQQAAAITDRVKIERTADTVPSFALIRLSQDFTVRQMAQKGPDGPAVPFQQVGGIIAFTPPAARTFTLWMRYAGAVSHRGSDYIRATEATLDSYWYPHIARLPATATVTATVPEGWTAIATGDRVQERKAADGAMTFTYRNDLPISFYTLDAGPYTITSRTVKGRTLSTWLLTPNPTLARSCLDLLSRALEFYDTHFAAFPFTHYTIVETQGPFDGALEAYSFATFGPGTLPSVIPHELAHTWWGGLVPCTYTHSMWDESFANYSDDLFQRVTQKPLGADKETRLDQGQAGLIRGSFVDACNAYAMKDACDTSNSQQSAVGYEKGQRVLRVLEEQIGQETMLRAMAAFIADHKRGEAAEWPEFERAVDKVTGQDYRWFFAEWVDRPGLPILELSNVRAVSGNASTQVEADVVQEGTPYRLKLPVTCTERNGDAVSKTVEIDAEPSAHISLRVPSDPTRLVLDPHAILPLESPSQNSTDTSPILYDFGSP